MSENQIPEENTTGEPADYPAPDAYSQPVDNNAQSYAQPDASAAYYQQQAAAPATYGQKSAMAAGLLGIFLGAFGIHNFYLGRTGLGVAQLLISLLSLGFLSPLSGIWGLIEGIMYLVGGSPRWDTDGAGYQLQR